MEGRIYEWFGRIEAYLGDSRIVQPWWHSEKMYLTINNVKAVLFFLRHLRDAKLQVTKYVNFD